MAMPCHRAWGNSRTLGMLRWERGKERVFRSEHFKPSIAHTRSVSSLLVKERAEVSGDSSQVSSSLLTLRFLNERNFWTLYWGCELTVKDCWLWVDWSYLDPRSFFGISWQCLFLPPPIAVKSPPRTSPLPTTPSTHPHPSINIHMHTQMCTHMYTHTQIQGHNIAPKMLALVCCSVPGNLLAHGRNTNSVGPFCLPGEKSQGPK